MIIFPRPYGYNFQLRHTVLRQLLPSASGNGWRQVRRNDLADLFQDRANTWDGTVYEKIDGCTSVEPSKWYSQVWIAIYREPTFESGTSFIIPRTSLRLAPGQLSIGCQIFSVEETQQIRHWALSYRRWSSWLF